MRHRIAALVFPLFVGGCYRYSAIEPKAAAPATDVRLNLTPAGSAALVSTLGVSTAAVEGKVVRVTESDYVLTMSSTLKRTDEDPGSMTRTVWAGESVSIPRSAVACSRPNSSCTVSAAPAAKVVPALPS